ncbi:MAG: hypothetical protein ABJA66_02365 [Actinomycetota bacterium]
MNVKTEILSAPKINQPEIETKLYDQDAQFYEYCESVENKTILEKENRSGKRIFLTGSLVIVGGFFLFIGLVAGFIYFSGTMFQSVTDNQISAENFRKDENGAVSFGESKSAENGFESEKTVKPNLSDDKNSSDKNSSGNFVKKEVITPNETKVVRINGQNDKNPMPDRNLKEFPETIDSSSKTTNKTFTQQPVQNSETLIVQSDSRRETLTNQPSSKNSQTQPAARQNQRDPVTQNNSERLQEVPKNRREFIVKKIKHSNFEERSNIKERLQRQRKRN